MKLYFSFFSDRLDIGIDMFVATKQEAIDSFKEVLAYNKLLYPA